MKKSLSIEGKSQWFDPPGIRKDATKDVVKCSRCGGEWFERILVQQFPKHAQVILGQPPTPINDIGYWLFRCIKCREIYEPAVHAGPRDAAKKAYNDFLDHMEKQVELPGDGEEV